MHKKHLDLDCVIELKVDHDRLLEMIVTRAREAAERGETVRADDNPEALGVRIDAYNRQTAPLAAYYRSKDLLRDVDGVQPMDAVTAHLFQTMGL